MISLFLIKAILLFGKVCKSLGRKYIDLSGKTFGNVSVVQPLATNAVGRQKHKKWLCKCNLCGFQWAVESGHLTSGQTQTCRQCANKRAATKHGFSKERLFGIWKGMIGRCYQESNTSYKNYGARGIHMCDEWYANGDISGYKAFREWSLVNGYADNLSIDRIDNECGYSPSNCRWATRQEQNSNTRQNVYYTYGGIKHTVAEWSRLLGIKAGTLAKRLRNGCDFNDAIKDAKTIITNIQT